MIEQQSHPDAISLRIDQPLATRELELKQLAVELSRQSERLKVREAEIIAREAELNRRREQFAAEMEGTATAAQSRRELAEEFARQQASWQEWNSAHQRSTVHLKSQLETLEQRRASVLIETARLESRRSEIQRMHAECHAERRVLAEERARANAEFVELQSRRKALEIECQHRTAESPAGRQQSEPLAMTAQPTAELNFARSPQSSDEQIAIATTTATSEFGELPENIRQFVAEHCQKAEELVQIDRNDDALDQYAAAWEMLPDPKNRWRAATPILIAATDIFFEKRDYTVAREILREFVDSCDSEIHSRILLRLGQSLFETGDYEAAYDALETASQLGGEQLFADEDPKYLAFVKTQMTAMAPVRSSGTSNPVNPPHRVAVTEHCKIDY